MTSQMSICTMMRWRRKRSNFYNFIETIILKFSLLEVVPLPYIIYLDSTEVVLPARRVW